MNDVLCQNGILFKPEAGVFIKDIGGNITGKLQDLFILDNIRYPEIQYAALLCTLQVSRTAKPEICFGYLKSIVCPGV